MLVKELIQDDFNENSVRNELNRLIYDEAYRMQIMQGYDELSTLLGQAGASAKAAEKMIEILSSAKSI